MRVLTIGGYGFTEEGFVRALGAAGVNVLVDVRQRRGMRGARYAFLNRERLQTSMSAAGIRYVHARELAPTADIRDAQKREDANIGIGKRDRSRLSPEFVRRYQTEILSRFDAMAFRGVLNEATAVALFCVEGHPDACHRSLAAEHIARAFGEEGPVEHLRP